MPRDIMDDPLTMEPISHPAWVALACERTGLSAGRLSWRVGLSWALLYHVVKGRQGLSARMERLIRAHVPDMPPLVPWHGPGRGHRKGKKKPKTLSPVFLQEAERDTT
jgi:hypothetical protein